MELTNLKKSELVHYCKKHNIQNYSNLKKTELIKHIKHSLNKKKGGKPSNTNLNPIIQITRHARSCNNEVKFKIHLKETDPSIVNRGIIQTILFAEENRTKFESNYVYVSCLLRTWITAICLYSIGQTDLILHISPYLKEKYTKSSIKYVKETGNHPVPLSKSIPKLLEFLNNNRIIFDDKKNKLKNQTNKTIIENFKLPNKLLLKFEQHDNTPQEIIIEKENKKFIIKKSIIQNNGVKINVPMNINFLNNINNDPIMNIKNKLYYQTDGKISKFIHWLKESKQIDTNKTNKTNETIHVVAHSNLMKDFLEGLNILNYISKSNFKGCTGNQCTNINKDELNKTNNKSPNINNNELEIINEIQNYISGTNCSMIQTNYNFCNKNIEIMKGYNSKSYTGPEYDSTISKYTYGTPKYGYDLCDYN
jgi:hypothetical protein